MRYSKLLKKQTVKLSEVKKAIVRSDDILAMEEFNVGCKDVPIDKFFILCFV